MTEEEYHDHIVGYVQQIGELQSRLDTMEMKRKDLNKAALEVALAVEDLYAQSHRGGRTQRLARTQVVIRDAMQLMLEGKTHWMSSVQRATEPDYAEWG